MEASGSKTRRILFLYAIFLLLIPALSLAQQFPTKPVNIYIGMAPGGAQDPAVRGVAAGAEKYLGQAFVCTNKGGGGGAVAAGLVAKEKPDGYHLLGTSTSAFYVPHIREVAYAVDDFVFVLSFATVPSTGLLVRADSPWKTLAEFLEYAKKNPGAINYGSSGVGGPQHLAMEFLAKQDGIQWTHVPYKGSSEAFMALLGGHITAQSGGVNEVANYVKTGKIRVLAIHDAKRSKTYPDVPTFKELGYNFVSQLYYFIAAPKGTPQAAVKKLEDVFHKGMDDPKFVQTMKNLEMEIVFRSSEETTKFLKEEDARIGQFVKEFKIMKQPGDK